MKEEWKDIEGYEGRYQISSFGRIKSLRDNHGNYREKILDIKPRKDGYMQVRLSKKGIGKTYKVHRLVALHFIENPNNYPQVNHKDENKQNNRVENLEWCTDKYNKNYGTCKERMIKTQKRNGKNKGCNNPMYGKSRTEDVKKKISNTHKINGKNKGFRNPRARRVLCITTDKEFNCVKEAAEYYNICRQNINKNCQGKIKYCGKHPITGEKLVWRYL